MLALLMTFSLIPSLMVSWLFDFSFRYTFLSVFAFLYLALLFEGDIIFANKPQTLDPKKPLSKNVKDYLARRASEIREASPSQTTSVHKVLSPEEQEIQDFIKYGPMG